MLPRCIPLFLLLAAPVAFGGVPGQHEPREGDEIVVAGQFFHTGTKVVLWMDPGGYDAYRVERRFVPIAQAGWDDSRPHIGPPKTPNRYSIREDKLTPAQLERIRGGGWDLPLLQSTVDQFVLHFDVEGTSRACFAALQDKSDLSVHLMLDLDGTIYQTLDLKERARHATSSNNRSVGVEIANVGAYSNQDNGPLATWYKKDATGQMTIVIPASAGPNSERTAHFTGHPARREVIVGEAQGKKLSLYDFTPQQYEALAKLTAAICTIFPKIKCDYPRAADGKLITHKLPGPELQSYEGVLGHYNIQTDKEDPGPALQWDYVIGEARRLMKLPPVRNAAGENVLTAPKLIADD
jgi:N-acetyl-anhydromuramyl-L-alanine amidase AmpD